MQHLFLQQSYQDCYEAYEKSLESELSIKWDYVILTASNEAQAAVYRQQLDYRIQGNYLPLGTKFVVLADPDGKRVGSGGATFNVLRYIAEDAAAERARTGADMVGVQAADMAECFHNKRILVIHSGGDSKRVPQYSVLGKLFSPVPRQLPDGRNATLFDEFIISMAGVAGRLKEGMLILSGDVLLLFNPLQIDFTFTGAAALSIKEPVSVGKNHGVFLNNGKDFVGRFLHKQSEEQLRACGAVNANDRVDLDTGAVALDAELLTALFSLISTNGKVNDEKFAEFVNEKARISFYGDFLYPLAEEATLESYYKEAAEGTLCEELLCCRTKIWQAISGFSMRLISLSPAEFIHFGTTSELLRLVTREIADYRFLGWEKQVGSCTQGTEYAAHNSLIEAGADIGADAYLENALVHGGSRVGGGSILCEVEIAQGITIPSGVVLHGLKQQNGYFVVRIYRTGDNPKDACGKLMSGRILEYIDGEKALWDAQLYPLCDTHRDAVEAALITLRVMQDEATDDELAWWQAQERVSLCESFNQAEAKDGFLQTLALQENIGVQKAVNLLKKQAGWETALAVFGKKGTTDGQRKQLVEIAKKADFSTAIRIYYCLAGEAKKKGQSFEDYEEACFETIRQAVYESGKSHVHYREGFTLKKDEAHVDLPVRVNWGGGWSDTPPHCLEKGGTVVNAAIKLNGIYPVQVTVRRIPEYKIEVASEDVGAYGELHSIEEVLDCHNPYDAFALHKAALIACGVIPMEQGAADAAQVQEGESAGEAAQKQETAGSGKFTLQDILKRLGGGIFLSTQVIGIPKGSGLGTSSILAGACVKAIFEIMGEPVSTEALYDIVLCMEQIMSTGGGWQDQVGGIAPGIKYITTEPGVEQHIKVSEIVLPEAAKAELQERFALIYTGQRRLARNLLRDVVGNYIGGRKESLEALYKMQRIAALMRFELEKGNIDELALLFNVHWEISKQLDAGSTNTCIEQIFKACEDLISGRFIAGAGGGGFLQVILKRGVTKEELRKRLHEVFQDSGVDVWESEFC